MLYERDGAGKICGQYRRAQDGKTLEELPDDHPDVVVFLSPPPPSVDELEAECLSFLNGGETRIDVRKVIKAKVISDLAFRLGKAPGALTVAELLTERNRIAAIYKAL